MAEDSSVLSVADVDVLVEFPLGCVAGDTHHHLGRNALGDGQRSEGSAGGVREQRLALGNAHGGPLAAVVDAGLLQRPLKQTRLPSGPLQAAVEALACARIGQPAFRISVGDLTDPRMHGDGHRLVGLPGGDAEIELVGILVEPFHDLLQIAEANPCEALDHEEVPAARQVLPLPSSTAFPGRSHLEVKKGPQLGF